MLIVFWSPVSGQAGTSTIFCSCAYFMSRMMGNVEMLMLRTKYKISGLMEILDSREKRFSTEEKWQRTALTSGIDHLFAAHAAGMPMGQVVKHRVVSLQEGLVVLEGTAGAHQEVYERELMESITDILEAVREQYQIVLLEAESGESSWNQSIMDAADYVVICLPQNLTVTDRFFQLPQPEKKLCYVFGKYQADTILNRHNLIRRYRKQTKGEILCFPYQTGLMEAYSSGRIIEYLERKCFHSGRKKSDSEELLQSLSELSNEVLGGKEQLSITL